MNAYGGIPIAKLRQAVTRYILHDLEDSVRLGVVLFNSVVKTIGRLTLLDSIKTRNYKLNEFIDTKVRGFTALGDGLMGGLKVRLLLVYLID